MLADSSLEGLADKETYWEVAVFVFVASVAAAATCSFCRLPLGSDVPLSSTCSCRCVLLPILEGDLECCCSSEFFSSSLFFSWLDEPEEAAAALVSGSETGTSVEVDAFTSGPTLAAS